MELVTNFTNLLASFIGVGEVNSALPAKKAQLENALQASVFSNADPTMGAKVNEVLGQISKNSQLSRDAKGRVSYLIAVQEAWSKLSQHLQPALDRTSSDLDIKMKASATQLILFLFANHILTDKGPKAFMNDSLYQAGKMFFDEISRLDVDSNQFGDYYEFMRRGIRELKTPKLPRPQQDEFNKRLAILDKTLEDAVKNRIAYFANQSPQKALKESLQMKYNHSPARAQALGVILKHLEIKDLGGRPVFEINIGKISQEWRAMAAAPLAEAKRKELVLAMNFLLNQLFERNGKMNVFWKNDFQKMDNFYDSVKRTMLSQESSTLEDLVKWARSEAEEYGLDLPEGSHPHVPLRKWTLLSETGVGVLGAGTAVTFHLAADDPNTKYWGRGAAISVAGAGLGAAGGNYLSYLLDVDKKYAWLFDVGGGILGGLAAGGIYRLSVSPPSSGPSTIPPNMDPGRRFPGPDEYGP
jgi:hypothetical protein